MSFNGFVKNASNTSFYQYYLSKPQKSSVNSFVRSGRSEVFLLKDVLKILRHGSSPVNLLHIIRTPFTKNISGWLLLFCVTCTYWKPQWSFDKVLTKYRKSCFWRSFSNTLKNAKNTHWSVIVFWSASTFLKTEVILSSFKQF